MNAQEIFDIVVTHLRKQGCKSFDDEKDCCMYRGPNGTKCAAGCLIPDDVYDPMFEMTVWSGVELDSARAYIGEEHTMLIERLQKVHDDHTPSVWEDYFQSVADDFNLTYTPPVV